MLYRQFLWEALAGEWRNEAERKKANEEDVNEQATSVGY